MNAPLTQAAQFTPISSLPICERCTRGFLPSKGNNFNYVFSTKETWKLSSFQKVELAQFRTERLPKKHPLPIFTVFHVSPASLDTYQMYRIICQQRGSGDYRARNRGPKRSSSLLCNAFRSLPQRWRHGPSRTCSRDHVPAFARSFGSRGSASQRDGRQGDLAGAQRAVL